MPDTDLMYRQMITAWRKMAEELAEAIRNHGPWMDDQCRAVLAKYDALRGAHSDGRDDVR